MKKHLMGLIEQFNKKKTDESRFSFLLEHKGVFMLMLDNDCTHLSLSEGTASHFPEDELDVIQDSITGRFDGYLGYSDGVISLLEVIGLKADMV